MNMTGFERFLRTLRGLAEAYDICIEFDNAYTTGMVVVKYGNTSEGTNMHYKKDIPISAIVNVIAFEEFLKETNREWKEVINGDHNKSERTDLSDMQSNDA